MTIKVHSAITFSAEIEKRSREGDCGYIEAIVDYCKDNGVEVETVSKLLTPVLKSKIREEAEDLNFLKKKGSKLDFLE